MSQMSTEILSVRIDTLDRSATMSKIRGFFDEDRVHQVGTVNPEFVMAAQKDLEFKETLNQTDLNIADGIGLQFAARVFGVEIGTRITGVDLTWELARLASEKGYSMFLLGAADGVAEKTAGRLREVYPELQIAGVYAGSPRESGLIERINQSDADILLVAYGAPKQDTFIFQNRNRLKVKVAMGVGGTFDYIAGVVPRAPEVIRRLGMEWMYRLIMQPQRINRIITATIRFPFAVIMARIGGG